MPMPMLTLPPAALLPTAACLLAALLLHCCCLLAALLPLCPRPQAERQYHQLSGMIEHKLEEARAWSREMQRFREQDETLAAAQLRRRQLQELQEGGQHGEQEGGQSKQEGEAGGQASTPAQPAPAVVPRRNARMRTPDEG